RLELGVGREAVPRYPEDPHAELVEIGVMIPKVVTFERASGRVVFRVEVQHERRPEQFFTLELRAVAHGRGERRSLLADCHVCHLELYRLPTQRCATGSMIASTCS